MSLSATRRIGYPAMGMETAAALFAGGYSLSMLLGAWAFQYMGGLAPCEMCIWQRWPHAAAIWLGLGAGMLGSSRILPRELVRTLAFVAVIAIAVTGAIGVFHAGVEWKFWPGPPACTGFGYVPGVSDNFQIVRCDEAQWRLFGISLAGFNAIFSLMAASVIGTMLSRKAG
jgi:disulfide bond formation protein DsbB